MEDGRTTGLSLGRLLPVLGRQQVHLAGGWFVHRRWAEDDKHKTP